MTKTTPQALPDTDKLIEIIKSIYPWEYNRVAFEQINSILGFTMTQEQEYEVYKIDRKIVAPMIEKDRMAKQGFIPTTIEWLDNHIGQKIVMIATGGLFGDRQIQGTLKRNGDWYIVMPPRCTKKGYAPTNYIKAA